MSHSEAKKALDEFFIEREGEGAIEEIRGMDLVDAGVLDSLDFVTLGVFIEQRTGRKLDLSDPVTFAAMRRYDSLLELLEEGNAGGDKAPTPSR